MPESNAAHDLLNRTLETGWKVIEKLEKEEGGTGSFFSVCYKVEKESEICFLKAYDFAKFLHVSTVSGESKQVVDIVADMVNSFIFERDLSNYCKNNHVTKVAFVKDSGQEMISGHSTTIVPYLIFDMANGDVRKFLTYNKEVDVVWKLHSLHSIAVGLKQLHAINVSHQDLKPSNVLLFDEESKIGDLGRSATQEISSPFEDFSFSGDYGYAPPEILYRAFDTNWQKRVFATDCYLLGSLIVFYFSGLTMTALIRQNIPDEFSWDLWRGSFEEVKDYLLDSYNLALNEFSENISNTHLKSEIKEIVKQLCFPIPEERGHPKTILQTGNSYNLERYVTKLDMLQKKSKFIYTK